MIIMLSVDDDVAKLNQYKNKYCIVSVETKSKDLFVQLLSRSKKNLIPHNILLNYVMDS